MSHIVHNTYILITMITYVTKIDGVTYFMTCKGHEEAENGQNIVTCKNSKEMNFSVLTFMLSYM